MSNVNPWKAKAGAHDKVQTIILAYKDIVRYLKEAIKSKDESIATQDEFIKVLKSDLEKYKDELKKERAIVDLFVDEMPSLTFEDTELKHKGFKRQMERRKQL